MKKIVDVSGFGHSGKTAVTDYLKSFPSVYSFPNHVEFELFRVAGGLVDLYQAIYENWSLLRSKVRIEEFVKLVDRIGRIQSKNDFVSYWKSSGHGYDQYFNHKFIGISHDFINALIKDKHTQFWPYELLRVSEVNLLFKKTLKKLFKRDIQAEIYYTERAEFIPLVNTYITRLFDEVGSSQHTHMVLNNAFEPFNPQPCFDMVPDSVLIVVDRDPRDIYASMINFDEVYVPDFEKYSGSDILKKNITGFGDINYFISRYKMLRDNVNGLPNDRVLKVNFEEFVLNNTTCSKKIQDFISLESENDVGSKIFDAEKSKKNIGLWKKYADLPEIKLIENQLSKFCYNS